MEEMYETEVETQDNKIPVAATKDLPEALISDEKYLSMLNEIVINIRDDREQVNDFIDNFAELVINGGDATTSSKEALVNLVKVKVDLQDKMLKALGEMGRIKLKNLNPSYNNVQETPQPTNFNKKELIRALNKAKKEKEN